MSLDHNVIHVCFHIPTDLSEQALLNHPHKCGSGNLQAEWHCDIIEAAKRGDKRCLYFVGSVQTDLVVPGVGIQKGQTLAPCSRVDYLVDARERKVVFRAGPIDMVEIDAHAK